MMKKTAVLLGRICLSLIFIASATDKLLHWNATENLVRERFGVWSISPLVPLFVQQGVHFLGNYAVILLAIAVLLEAIGGLFVLLGFRVQLGATLLIVFLIPVTIVMHPFWLWTGHEGAFQMTLFMKNVTILGGLLIVAAKGKSVEG